MYFKDNVDSTIFLNVFMYIESSNVVLVDTKSLWKLDIGIIVAGRSC